MRNAAEEHQRRLDEPTRRLATGTGQRPDRVADDLRHGRLPTAAEAIEDGLVAGTSRRHPLSTRTDGPAGPPRRAADPCGRVVLPPFPSSPLRVSTAVARRSRDARRRSLS